MWMDIIIHKSNDFDPAICGEFISEEDLELEISEELNLNEVFVGLSDSGRITVVLMSESDEPTKAFITKGDTISESDGYKIFQKDILREEVIMLSCIKNGNVCVLYLPLNGSKDPASIIFHGSKSIELTKIWWC